MLIGDQSPLQESMVNADEKAIVYFFAIEKVKVWPGIKTTTLDLSSLSCQVFVTSQLQQPF